MEVPSIFSAYKLLRVNQRFYICIYRLSQQYFYAALYFAQSQQQWSWERLEMYWLMHNIKTIEILRSTRKGHLWFDSFLLVVSKTNQKRYKMDTRKRIISHYGRFLSRQSEKLHCSIRLNFFSKSLYLEIVHSRKLTLRVSMLGRWLPNVLSPESWLYFSKFVFLIPCL